MLADAVDSLSKAHGGGGAGRGPQGEELRSIGAGGIRRNRGVKIRERQMETVAQHLKRRELADEIRIHAAPMKSCSTSQMSCNCWKVYRAPQTSLNFRQSRMKTASL